MLRTRAIAWTYEVEPYTGRAVSVIPGSGWDRGQLYRSSTVEHVLPWTPHSYPGVGREPGAFIPPDVAAIPASGAPAGSARFDMGTRKAQMGGAQLAGAPG